MESDEHDAILVIRISSLGDILLTAPAFRALRRRFPDSRIDLLTGSEFRDAASLIPGIDQLLGFERRSGWSGLWKLRHHLSRRYSFVVDLQNSPKSALLRSGILPFLWVKAKRYRFRRWLLVRTKWNTYGTPKPIPLRYGEAIESLGAEDDGAGLKLRIPVDALAWAAEFIRLNGDDRQRIALCPGARHFTKRWPADYWIETGRMLASESRRICVIGSADEAELINQIASGIPNSLALSGSPIPQVAAVLQGCAAVVSNDSGLMHLAAGVGAPVAAIFGPTVEEFGFFPFRAQSVILQQEISCRPCRALGGPKCPKKHFRCMLDTHPRDVALAVEQLIG